MLSSPFELHWVDRNPESFSEDLLSAKERERFRGFHSRERAQIYAATRMRLRDLLSSLCGCAPQQIEIFENAHGKPMIKGSSLHFSIAHTSQWAVIALSQAGPIGIDLEVPSQKDFDALAKRTFASEMAIDRLSSLEDYKRKQSYFFKLWTVHEALIKMFGASVFHGELTKSVLDAILEGTEHWEGKIAASSEEIKYLLNQGNKGESMTVRVLRASDFPDERLVGAVAYVRNL